MVDERTMRDLVRLVVAEKGISYPAAVDWIILQIKAVAKKAGWEHE